MGIFLFLAVILQQLIQWVRKEFTQVDGKIVQAVAVVVGIAAAYFIPEARIIGPEIGVENPPLFVDVLGSGLAMALGMSFIRDGIKALSTSVEKPASTPDAEIP